MIPIIPAEDKISQGDIFHDISIIENVEVKKDQIKITDLALPLAICLNQECDLSRDFENKNRNSNKNTSLLHFLILPIFNFDLFKDGIHWGNVFDVGDKKGSKDRDVIKRNSDPRYHYLEFKDKSILPDCVIDFKHFYTVSNDTLNKAKENRIGRIPPLFREAISQRFAYYISRIGLPV
ncbi:MAG: hypothetical protein LUD17_16780 [Bacteroidales bacterium]|nr:hypothetical protein [Bacteroidales bacterium]